MNDKFFLAALACVYLVALPFELIKRIPGYLMGWNTYKTQNWQELKSCWAELRGHVITEIETSTVNGYMYKVYRYTDGTKVYIR